MLNSPPPEDYDPVLPGTVPAPDTPKITPIPNPVGEPKLESEFNKFPVSDPEAPVSSGVTRSMIMPSGASGVLSSFKQ